MDTRPGNVLTLHEALTMADDGGFALGSFSPRYTPMIRPVLRAGQMLHSPLIVQISQKELDRYGIAVKSFAHEFYDAVRQERVQVPVVLHLDHTKDKSVIEDAIACGFTSVMIDASEQELDENIRITKQIVEYAHARGVSVEAELGKIGTTDFLETDTDEEMYTDPEDAARFVQETGVDALAVSVGTAHGVYKVKEPSIDFARIERIRKSTDAFLVLHGGSGVPSWMVKQSIQLGIRKVNIATDLELALLKALAREERMSNAEMTSLAAEDIAMAQRAVEVAVMAKVTDFLGSKDRVIA
ncbi:class II fructose-bisphosphate aldolase [Alicyclobacillus fastidiosus]|uniref:Class II fructose-bisphosphate aldolase n=1 Tax=Alicyclobacillus fastidiosus TaxID=392011 RepID=A0ABV5ALN8_9BACL|nr:class II fructose-bisphosphate aldolase [Alicyclobacillus fastidiosus]WEH08045.1 class II fructose-bisphosphate aldolase [Alicyclobacillus fastidiosus]